MKIVILVGCLLFGISCSQPKKCHHRSFLKKITDSAFLDSIKYIDAIGIANCGELINSKYYFKLYLPELFWSDSTLYIRKQKGQYYLLSKNEYLKTHRIKEYLFLDFDKKKGDFWYVSEAKDTRTGYEVTIVFDSIWHNPDFTKIQICSDSLSPKEKKEWQYKGELYCFSLYPHSFTCGHIYATKEDIEYMTFDAGSFNSFLKFRPKIKRWNTKNKPTY